MKRNSLQEFIISVAIVIWVLLCGIQVYQNYIHYKLSDWLMIAFIILIPCIIGLRLLTKKSSTPEIIENKTDDNYIIPNNTAVQPKTSQEFLNASSGQLNKIPASDNATKVTIQNADTTYPEEVLSSMRTAYSPMQVQDDIRVLNDCINLLCTTTNLDTFFSRYELASKKIMTLEQAKAAGIPINMSITSDYVMTLKKRADEVLQATYDKELKEIDALKTVTGKKNRLDKFILHLSEYYDEFEFSSTYSNIMNSLNLYKKSL